MNSRPRVLITDAGERAMLAACRGLSAAGFEVTAAAFGPLATVHWSRCCSSRLRVRDPRADAEGFIEDLRAELERRPHSLLMTGSDFSLFAVSRWRERLEHVVRLGLPPHAAVQRAFDREALATEAAGAGLAAPAEVRCRDVHEAARAARELGYPVLLKSVSTVREAGAAIVPGQDTRWINSEPELRSTVDAYGDAFLVQRAEAGRLLSFAGVMADGRLIGAAVSAYERTWPPAAGSVCAAITFAPRSELEQRVTALLSHLGWQGVFELEAIERDTGAVVPIDLNPRPYGSMALAIAAGANLPGLWGEWMLQRPLPSGRAAPGRRYRWEDADLRHLLWQVRRRELRAAARTLRPRRRVVHPHFTAHDPLPLLARGLWLARRKGLWLARRHRRR